MVKRSGFWIFLGQCTLSLVALMWVFKKLDPQALASLYHHFKVMPWLGAFLLYNISQMLSAMRCRIFLAAVNMQMQLWQHVRLYYLGMFYQLFIPGGIGGDGVRLYCMRKSYQGSTLTLVRALLVDRLSGFLALLACSALASVGLPLPWATVTSVTPAMAVTVVLLLLVSGRFVLGLIIEHDQDAYMRACVFALIVQSLQAIAALCLLNSFGESDHWQIYTVVFFISSICSQLPVSISGLGTRELVVMWLLTWFGLAYDAGVAMAFAFFCLQSLANCLGVLCYRQEKLACT